MNRLLIALFLAFTLCSAQAFADTATCPAKTSVTTAATTLLAANDVVGGRHYFLLQNLGSATVTCMIGGTATTTAGFAIPANGSWFMQSIQGAQGVFSSVPNGVVTCISSSSTQSVDLCTF